MEVKQESVENDVEQEDVSRIQFRFPPAPHSGKLSLTLENASKSYDDLHVLEAIDLEIVKGEKIAFVGKNGEGKSTLAKMIVGEIDYSDNIFRWKNYNLKDLHINA